MSEVKTAIDESDARPPDHASCERIRAGGADDADDRRARRRAATLTILKTARAPVQTHIALRRVYYSAFSPIPHAPRWLEPQDDGRTREHRLYQADWLIRHYRFSASELTTEAAPNLPSHISPKLAWALRHPEAFPIDVNTAPREQLLRVPGVGLSHRRSPAAHETASPHLHVRPLEAARPHD